jgi:hypothetical protein
MIYTHVLNRGGRGVRSPLDGGSAGGRSPTAPDLKTPQGHQPRTDKGHLIDQELLQFPSAIAAVGGLLLQNRRCIGAVRQGLSNLAGELVADIATDDDALLPQGVGRMLRSMSREG